MVDVRNSPSGKLVYVALLSVANFGVFPGAGASVTTTQINKALEYANTAGAELYWPEGDYNVSANLPNFHSIRHSGPGAIVRGSDRFYVQPKYGQNNKLYVAVNGSITNDGLSASLPLNTPDFANSCLRNYGPVLNGSWDVVLAAGSYALSNQTFDTPSRDWVVVRGPVAGHPNIPTAIFDGTAAGANRHGFIVNGTEVNVWVRDVKFQNYNAGTQNSCGIAQGYNARLYAQNVHCTNCDFAGVLADQADICLVGGGIYDGCRSGVILNATRGTVGYGAAALADGCIFRNCTQNSVYWSRGAQGHVDYCLFQGNAITPDHLVLEASARAHVMGNDFRTATRYAITTNTGGSYYDDVTIVNIYNDGTGLANAGGRYGHFAYSGEQQRQLQAGRSEFLWYVDDTVRTVTNVAKTQFTGAAIKTLPAWFFGPQGTKVRFKIWGDAPASSMSIGIDFNALQIDLSASVGAGGGGGFEYSLDIPFSSYTTARAFARLDYNNLGFRIQNGAVAPNMGLAQVPSVWGLSAAGTITIRRIEMWVIY